MPRIPLVEHERPRILAVDFSKPEIEKLKSAGLSVQRAATGLYDQGKVCIPCSIQDVEIILFSCHKDALDNIADRPVSEESILEGPYFGALVEEVWNKYGWTIFFVKDGFSPESFAKLGISNLGVVEKDGYQFSPARYRQLLSYQNNNFKEKNTTFPKFKGQAVKINDSYKECIILQRFVKSAGYYILGIDSDEFRRLIVIFGRGNIDARWLITDEATDTGILALRFQHDFAENDPYQHYYGGIFILPDFGDHNIDVSLTLINEILIDFNPMIFSETKHGWLKDYRAHPVALIEQQKIKTLNDAIKEAEELDKTIEQLSDRYSWMDQLLCGEGEDFSQAAAEALEFLGYEVQLIDNQLAPGQRKREDLHVIDKAASYFALGETKSTRRGASEGFLTDVQNHQGRYSRENQCPIPMAILVVNHSHDLNPNQRGPRFYIDPAILDRCREQGITAIDSVFLHELCQKTLARALSQEQAREIIQSGPGLLPYTPKLPQ